MNKKRLEVFSYSIFIDWFTRLHIRPVNLITVTIRVTFLDIHEENNNKWMTISTLCLLCTFAPHNIPPIIINRSTWILISFTIVFHQSASICPLALHSKSTHKVGKEIISSLLSCPISHIMWYRYGIAQQHDNRYLNRNIIWGILIYREYW